MKEVSKKYKKGNSEEKLADTAVNDAVKGIEIEKLVPINTSNVPAKKLKQEIVKTAKALYEKGLITVLGGNISARIPKREEIWITPSRLCKSELREGDLVKIDLNGNILEGKQKPSVEKLMHIHIYKARPDAHAVIHAHNPLTLALITAGLPLEPATVEAEVLLGKPEVLPPLAPGSEELADAVEKAASEGAKLIILEKHGVVGIGRSLLEARAVVELAEDISKIILISHLLGNRNKSILSSKRR